MTPDERWLAATWPFVHAHLPAAPAEVVEIGCGPLGGFIPAMRAAGYRATGVDPEAPQGPEYRRTVFEDYQVPGPVAAFVACTSLHHVADLGGVLDRAGAALAPGGPLVIVEWAHERFGEATARWCFDRLPARGDGDEHDWLRHRQEDWRDSGLPWDAYQRSWAADEGLHTGQAIMDALGARFDTELVRYGPYFFADLGIGEPDEQAAIDAGLIQANGIRYVGTKRSPHPGAGAIT